jgi:hypothetical protein
MHCYVNRLCLFLLASFFPLFSMELAVSTTNNSLIDKIRKKSYLTEVDTQKWFIPKSWADRTWYLGMPASAFVGFATALSIMKNNAHSHYRTKQETEITGPLVAAAVAPAFVYCTAGKFCYDRTQASMWKRVCEYVEECEKYVLTKEQPNSVIDMIYLLNEKNRGWLTSHNGTALIRIEGALDELYDQGSYAQDLLEKLDDKTLHSEDPEYQWNRGQQYNTIKNMMAIILYNKNMICRSEEYEKQIKNLKNNIELAIDQTNAKANEIKANAEDKKANAAVAKVAFEWTKYVIQWLHYFYKPGIFFIGAGGVWCLLSVR